MWEEEASIYYHPPMGLRAMGHGDEYGVGTDVYNVLSYVLCWSGGKATSRYEEMALVGMMESWHAGRADKYGHVEEAGSVRGTERS